MSIFKLTDDEAKKIGRDFTEKFLETGFGTLPKKEIEIYLYFLLSQTDAIKNKSNYEIANILKINESKVKSLRLDSSIKYSPVNSQDALKKLAKMFFETYQTKLDIDDDYIQFGLEDPVLKREFENAVKQLGRHVEYTLNKEVLRVKASTFLAMFISNFDDINKKFAETVKTLIKDEGEYKKIFAKSFPLFDRIERALQSRGKSVSVIGILAQVLASLK